MRILGILTFLAGAAATAWLTAAIHRHHRPADVLYALLAPVACLLALAGLLLSFVPDFFS